jgi:hypothetical protein
MLTLYVLIRWWLWERRLRQRDKGRAAPTVRASPVAAMVSQRIGDKVAVGAQGRHKTLSSATFRDPRRHTFGSTEKLHTGAVASAVAISPWLRSASPYRIDVSAACAGPPLPFRHVGASYDGATAATAKTRRALLILIDDWSADARLSV